MKNSSKKVQEVTAEELGFQEPRVPKCPDCEGGLVTQGTKLVRCETCGGTGKA